MFATHFCCCCCSSRFSKERDVVGVAVKDDWEFYNEKRIHSSFDTHTTDQGLELFLVAPRTNTFSRSMQPRTLMRRIWVVEELPGRRTYKIRFLVSKVVSTAVLCDPSIRRFEHPLHCDKWKVMSI